LFAETAKPLAARGEAQNPVLLVYTSGTTGQPKGALHTQEGLIWNAANAVHCHDLTTADHVLTVLPMFHVGGLCIQTVPALHAGATVTLHPRFDPGRWLADVESRRPTFSLLVPATIKAVLEHPPADSRSVVAACRLHRFVYDPRCATSTVSHREAPLGQFTARPKPDLYRFTYALRMQSVEPARQAGLFTATSAGRRPGQDIAPGEVGEIWVRAPT
jgi:fatty-acyl-CoA synthase